MSRESCSLVFTLGALAVVTLLALPVTAADLLIYQTPEGRVVLSNRSLPRDAEIIFRRPPSRPLPAASNANSPPEAQLPGREARSQVPVPRNNAVDIVALAQIMRDMSMADVRGILGTPGRVVELDPTVRVSSDRSDGTGGRLDQSVWVYPGPALAPSAHIWFVNGRVARVKRVW